MYGEENILKCYHIFNFFLKKLKTLIYYFQFWIFLKIFLKKMFFFYNFKKIYFYFLFSLKTKI